MSKILWLYFCLAVSIILHELAHFFTGYAVGLKKAHLYIGETFFRINIGKIHISPLIYSGYVDFETELEKLSVIQLFFVSFSGTFVNAGFVIVTTIISCMSEWNFLLNGLLLINLVLCLESVIPIKWLKNDCWMFVRQSRKAE